jgi:argininosuccinate lyase
VSDRDFERKSCSRLLAGVHLSRLAEDLIIYSNPALAISSTPLQHRPSLMPQKRNPDPMELARGKAGRLIGHLTGLLATLKGLPSSYNKDLQEDKEALFDAVDTMRLLLPVITAVVDTLQINPDRMRAALSDDMLATDLADYLVSKGMPFREAHHVIGTVVRIAAEEGIALSQMPLEQLRKLSDLFEADVASVFDFQASIARRNGPGGTAPSQPADQAGALGRQFITLHRSMGQVA